MGNNLEIPKTPLETLSIPADQLEVGGLYAVLLLGNSTWCYGVYNYDSVAVTDKAQMPLESESSHTLLYARTGPGRWATTLASFYPITVDVDSMVNTWRAEEPHGDDRPLQRVGWDLATHLRERAWARRKYAVAAWAAARAALVAEETTEETATDA